MTIVRVIFVDTTRPVRIRPRMDTSPVKGHFLSAANVCPLNVSETTNKLTNVSAVDRLRGGLEAKTNILVPPLLFRGDLLA